MIQEDAWRTPLASRIKTEHKEQLIKAAAILDQSVQSLIDEAVEEHLECTARAYVEDVTERASKA